MTSSTTAHSAFVVNVALHDIGVSLHLGPELHGNVVTLSWTTGEGATASAGLHLSDAANWRLVRGGTDPVLGWYSARLGEKQPTTTIIGEGTCHGRTELETALVFHH